MARAIARTLLVLMLCGAPLSAAADADPPRRWEFTFAPYLWGAGLEGTVNADRVSADVDVSFSEIWDALDLGVLAAFEARRGKLSITSNLIYLDYSTDADRPVGPVLPIAPPGSFRVRTATEQLIFELRPTWEILSLPLFDPSGKRRAALDLGFGARAIWLDSQIHAKLRPGLPIGPFSRRFDHDFDWVDWVGVARVRARLTERIGLVVAGDYGGFDLGTSSHRTWSLQGFLSYRLGAQWDVALGWRTLEIERGAFDVEMAGPLLGVGYRF